MGKAYKNFWSLNTDEAIVAGILRSETDKNIEVLMPLNAQMKDVDLVLINIKNKKTLTIQVKGSRAFEPTKNESRKYISGSAGWFFFHRDVIHKSTADYFIFLIYVLEQKDKEGRRYIKPHAIIIPTYKLKKMAKKYKKSGKTNSYNFLLWVDPDRKIAFDFRDKKYSLSAFLDEAGLNKINKSLK